MSRDKKNLQEWDKLYQSTEQRIWGDNPIEFLFDYVEQFEKTLNTSSKILDAGTGEGRNLSLISRIPGQLHAVDGSKHALSKIPIELKNKIDIQQALLHELPYENDTFDLIFGIDIFETLPNIQNVLNEFVRILKKDGHLICNIPSEEDTIYGIDMENPIEEENAWMYQNKYYYKFYSPDEVMHMFSNAGLRVISNKRYEWMEQAHPNFRSNDHKHISQVYVGSKI